MEGPGGALPPPVLKFPEAAELQRECAAHRHCLSDFLCGFSTWQSQHEHQLNNVIFVSCPIRLTL